MKVLIDLNVMLDFLQRRQPFFEHAATVMDAILYKTADGVLAAHAVTTLHYFLAKGADRSRIKEILQWLLNTFEVVSCDKEILAQALTTDMKDYEDAVISVSASRAGCSYIITRNTGDFANSSVPPVSPVEFQDLLEMH